MDHFVISVILCVNNDKLGDGVNPLGYICQM